MNNDTKHTGIKRSIIVNEELNIGLNFEIIEYRQQWKTQVSLTIKNEKAGDKNFILDGDTEELVAFDKFIRLLLCNSDNSRKNYHNTIGELEEICWKHNNDEE